jgi:hypothetical protein
MASPSPDAAGLATNVDDAPSHSQDSASIASSPSRSSLGSPSCPWKTPEFHDQECSRYFDCPSHILERSHSSPTEHRADHPRSLNSFEYRGTSSRSGEVAQNEESGPAVSLRDRPLPPQPTENQSQPEGGPVESGGRMASSARRPSQASVSRFPPTPATPGRYEFQSGAERTLVPLAHGPLPALPHDRLRPHAGSRRSSEYLAPRWQPDVEATYCPICQTQFSFFVRKHHCR